MKKLLLSTAALTLLAVSACAQSVITDASSSSSVPAGFESAMMKTADVNLHYVRDGGPGETVILMHGWPQTWQSWVEVMPLLEAKYDVIAIDLRGSGKSDKPANGYDKKTMAGDVRALMDELGIQSANIVGHDIGGMTAFAFASQFPEMTASVTIIDVPIPGTDMFEMISNDPRAWHFAFHNAPEVPETLTQGNEAYYYGHFMRQFDAGSGGIGDKEIAITVEAFSNPDNAKAGFEWYRAFSQDNSDNKVYMETKLEMPLLGLNAERLAPFPYVVEMMTPFATIIEGGMLDSGHWIPETRPDELAAQLDAFFSKH